MLKKRYSLFGGLCVFLSALHSHCSAEILTATGQTHLTCDSKQPAFCSHTTLHELIPYTAVEHARSEGHSLTHVSQHQISLHLPPQGNICTEAHDLSTVTLSHIDSGMFLYFKSDALSESNSCWSTVCVCVWSIYSPSMAVLMSTPTQ